MVNHSSTKTEDDVDSTYRELGGFQITIPIDQPDLQFIDQISYLKYESDFWSSGTISALCEIMFYNSVTNSFVFIAF